MPGLTGDPNQHDASKFSDSISGSCLCGSITVTITDPELFSKPRGHLCHCSNCRKVAGSFVSSNLLIEAEKVKIDDRDGTLTTYEDRATGSGNPVYRFFCSKDGNPIKSETQAYPGKVVVKMGMMPRIPQPEMESFGLHKHAWQGKHKDMQTFKIRFAGPDKELLE
ncbi:hypothetical protein LTR86_004105 [Recurvomyces mirabilis]|nr:hypothetical protein LTR86_004105 [Recurvomyces mirabilis]